MKLFKQSLLVAAVLSGLTACSEDDYSPEAQVNDNAPTHGGDISVIVNENDAFQFLYMLGTQAGQKSGDGIAIDLDGNILSVTDVSADTEDLTGIEIGDLKVGVRPELLKDQLDTGDTRTVTLSYKVTDGINTVDRKMVINIEGEDFAPEVSGDLSANFTKDSTASSLDLLSGVTDADGEVLTVADLTADATNPFDLPVSLSGTDLNIDIASVKDQIPDGSKLTFKFTYNVKDHNHSIERNVSINVLGVKDVPGAPLFAEYFLSDELTENSNAKVYDLIQGAVDREGDQIVVQDLKLDGSTDLPFAAELEGTNLKFYPTAYLTEIQAGKSKTLEFTYRVADENGNQSDGERTLTIKVNGVESNILVKNGATSGFEGLAEGDLAASSGWAKFGWENPILPQVSKVTARSGENSVFIDSGVGIVNNWPAQENRVYYYAGWFKTVDPVTSNFVHFNAYGEADAGRAWWDGGFRPWVADSTQWNEGVKVFHTFEGGLPIYPKAAFQAFNGPAGGNSTTGAYVDDIKIVDITDIDPMLNDLLADNAGLFESDDLPTNNGEGNITITQEAQFVSDGTRALSVDTTGKSGYSADVMLPIKAGAIKAGGRYMLQLNIQASNAAADIQHQAFEARLETANGNVLAFGQVWGNGKNEAVRVVLNTEAATGTPDWQAEDVSLRILFKLADTQFYVDNVTVFAIP
ncbi:hypothetical protein N7931_08175 [Catenovulum sp. 2E275]|uniref:hypothetical protein n=1 Tax=Catenovulum sp. 2E275 TaxID=2980497 RepID=UPI0021D2239E|nr:hypothetical protein [Catenovulum sp. 2E275]MCU4675610.1 hypothetical protein [Catenovulum sp. 2E275]